MSSEPRRQSYIPTLDGWRAIAVLLVIGAHSVPMLEQNGSWLAHRAASFLSHAGYGVDIFFAISGYLICTLLLAEKQKTGTISLAKFYTRRAFRILPPIVVFMAVIATLSALGVLPRIDVGEIVGTLLFFRNYTDGGWYTGHFWSLAVEEQFYAVIPVLLLLLTRRRAVAASLALIGACIATRWFEFAHEVIAGSNLQFRTENRCDGLMWGALLAIALQSEAIREWLRSRLTWQTVAGLLTVLIAMLEVRDGQPWRRTLVAAFMPLFLAFTMLHARGIFGRFLESAPMRWIGRISYSLYIWQMLFCVPARRPLGFLQSFPMAIICAVGCACFSYYVIEKRAIRMGHRLAAASINATAAA